MIFAFGVDCILFAPVKLKISSASFEWWHTYHAIQIQPL